MPGTTWDAFSNFSLLSAITRLYWFMIYNPWKTFFWCTNLKDLKNLITYAIMTYVLFLSLFTAYGTMFFGCELIKLKLYFLVWCFRVVYSMYNSVSKPFSTVGDTLFRALLSTIVHIVVINSIFLQIGKHFTRTIARLGCIYRLR